VLAVAFLGCEREAPAPLPVVSAAPEPPVAPKPVAAPDPPALAPAPVETASATAAKTATTSKTADKPGPAPTPSAAQASAKRTVKTVAGSGASGEGFSVSIQAPSPVRSGEMASAVVVLSAKDPYKCNEKYPYKLVLDAPSGGVSYPQQTVRGMSIGQKQSTMSVPFSPGQAGSVTVAGLFHFSICTADKCLIEKQRVSVTVQAD
jgi:hypothetical protein